VQVWLGLEFGSVYPQALPIQTPPLQLPRERYLKMITKGKYIAPIKKMAAKAVDDNQEGMHKRE